ncbi:MAG: glycerophosphodiester phosphodiesterase, partial [Caldilineaceae bacterium]
MRRQFWIRFLVTGLIALLVVVVAMHLTANRSPGCSVCDRAGERPLVIAHQGGDGERPSNTMLAFEHAAAMGVDMLEMDVHATADGHLVLMHDDSVDRLTEGTGLIREMTLAEFQALDAGYDWSPLDDGAEYPYRGQGVHPPTLAEVLRAFPDMPMNIEIKQETPSIAAALCSALAQAGKSDQVLVVGFRQSVLDEFRRVCPAVETSLGEDEVRDFFYRTLAFFGATFSANGVAVQVPIASEGWTILTPRFVRSAHGRGMDVHAWTIDDPVEMQQMIDLGVDGIITDQPAR